VPRCAFAPKGSRGWRLAGQEVGGGQRADEECLRQGHGSGEYVHLQTQRQGKLWRIDAPLDEELVGSKIPAGVGRAEREEVPTLLIGPQYRPGRPVHKGRAKARQVRPYAWPGHRTHISMQPGSTLACSAGARRYLTWIMTGGSLVGCS
jgi:hypothetical protein